MFYDMSLLSSTSVYVLYDSEYMIITAFLLVPYHPLNYRVWKSPYQVLFYVGIIYILTSFSSFLKQQAQTNRYKPVDAMFDWHLK